MKPLLTITRADWVALCLVVLCVTPYGCKDSASVSDKPDVPLASLSVTPATLLPAFSSETTSYTAQAPTTATSVTVTATPQDSTVTVSIDGTIGTQRSIALDQPGSTKTIPIVLTTQTGTDSTYSVRVTRLLSGDNNLKTLTVTPGSLSPLFDPTKPDYTLDVATNISTVTIAATKADPGAVLSGTVSNDGRATIQLDGPGTSKAVSIIVTAPNGESKTYRITINRAASSNNNLSALRVQVGTADQTLSPGFTSGAINYRVDVGTTVTSITITATKADPLAVISGGVPNEGQATIPLDGPGTSKVVLITVTAQDATTSKTYRVTVNRRASNDSSLSALTVSAGTLDPPFASNILNYTVQVGLLVGSVTITATKTDPNAIMSSLGSSIAAAGTSIGQVTVSPALGVGTTVDLTLIAQDGINRTEYKITVTRGLF